MRTHDALEERAERGQRKKHELADDPDPERERRHEREMDARLR